MGAGKVFFRPRPVELAKQLAGLGGIPHSELMARLDKLQPCCHHENVSLSVNDVDDGLTNKLNQMAERVWRSKGIPVGGLDADIVTEYASRLWTGVTQGYGIDLPGIDWDSPDYATLQALRTNVWQFSAAKNYQQLTAISRELLDANGKIRSFSDFRDAAQRINIAHTRHLETEYNTAVAGGQMAGKWAEIEADIDVLPYLQFEAVMDGNTTDTCASLHGVIRRADDAFWQKWYPPNHYNCRSTVRRLADAKETPVSEINYPTGIPEMFQVNLGQSGLAFPADHPYFDGLPTDIQTFGDAGYRLNTARNGKGQVYESGAAFHPKKAKDPRYQAEYRQRLEVADKLADYLDTDVYITPEILNTDWRYPYFFENTPVPGKLPDFKAGQTFWDLKSYEKGFKFEKIGRMIKSGAGQADHIVIKLNHNISPERIGKRIHEYMAGEKLNVKRVIVVGKDNNVLIDVFK